MLGRIARFTIKSKINLFSSTSSWCEYSSRACPSIAVVLSGCGVNDGSEIHEAVAVLSHLTRNNANPTCFAPNIPQADVINHLEGAPDQTHSRNVLVEAARIARGQVKNITDLAKNISEYDAVVFPGGFGVAKNLSNFASCGAECTVIPDVVTILQEFHKCKKPIGLCCIAPILAARVLSGVTITLGKDCEEDKWPYKDAIKAASQMGAKVENKEVNEVSVDTKNMVYSTPAFMYGPGKFHEIDDGVGNMIKCLVDAVKNK